MIFSLVGTLATLLQEGKDINLLQCFCDVIWEHSIRKIFQFNWRIKEWDMVIMNIFLTAFSVCKYVNSPASATKYYPSGFLNLEL